MKKKKPVLTILIVLVTAAIVILALKYLGLLGIGSGFSNKTGDGADRNIPAEEITSTASAETTLIETESETEAKDYQKSCLIEVKQDEYYIEDKVTTLEEIKEMISKDNINQINLENNYASSKAWEELKKALAETDVTVIEN